jgi:hypothetical protein
MRSKRQHRLTTGQVEVEVCQFVIDLEEQPVQTLGQYDEIGDTGFVVVGAFVPSFPGSSVHSQQDAARTT